MLYFQDEAGVSLIPFMRTTWAPKGKTPIIKVTGKKGGICVSSAISLAGRMVFRIEKGRMTSETYIDFLAKIILQHPRRKIVIIFSTKYINHFWTNFTIINFIFPIFD